MDTQAFGKNLELFVWGLNDNHQLGQVGSLDSSRGRSRSYSPMKHSSILIPRLARDIDFKVQEIACGSCHTLILSAQGELYGLGNNSNGQLGKLVKDQPSISWPTKIEFNSAV